jgi:urease accessory protein
MLQLIQSPLAEPDLSLEEVVVRVERMKIAKRVWRGLAEDGVEFGFELTAPLKDGDVVWQAAGKRYVVRQEREAVLEISLEIAPSGAAGIGWAVGNLHLELMAEPTRLLTPDDAAARQLLARLKVPFAETTAVFRPGRFARGDISKNTTSATEPVANHELGTSHKH